MTSLDELFDEAEETRADQPSSHRTARWLLKAGLLAAVLAGGLVLALHLVGIALPYLLAFAGLLALSMLHRAVRVLEVMPSSSRGSLPEPVAEPAGSDGLALAAGRWQTLLSYGQMGLGTHRKTAASALAELVDARLQRTHGITRDSDPVRSRELLGERLWSYLANPAARTPPPRELAAMLTQVEKL